MIVQTRGVVLQARDFSESSQIVALWTEGFGRVTGIAKGVRRQGRASFDGPFEAASEYELGFYLRSQGEGLSILSEASLRARPASVRETLEGWWAFSEAAEAVLGLTQEMDPHPGLLAAFRDLLDPVPGRPDALTRFLLRLLEATGHAPSLDRCGSCGNALPEGIPTAFAFWGGGAVCAVCAPRAGALGLLPAGLREGLRGLPAPLPPQACRGAEALLGRTVAHLVGQAPAAAWCRARARRGLQRLRR